MQRLKEELNERILRAAREEFMRDGFRDASMRAIAHEAGVVVGNLYRYSPSKKALFESLVKPAYDSITSLVFDDTRLGKMIHSPTAFVEPVTDALVAVHARFGPLLLILVEKSGGTVYENTKAELVQRVADRLRRELRLAKRIDLFLVRVVTTSFVDAFFQALKEYEDDAAGLQETLRRLLRVFFADIGNRIGGGKK
jgi:AcrR family transcriptional regulator